MIKVNFPLGNAVIAWLAINIMLPLDGLGFETASRGRYPQPQHRNEDGNVLVFDNNLLDRLFGKDRAAERGNTNNDLPLRDAIQPPKVFNGTNLPTVLPNRSLLAGISSSTNSRRAAALRLAEKGRKLIENKEYQNAISFLEKALSLDASPFIHYYLARAHYFLGNSQGSLNFLEVAESRLSGLPEWLDEITTLRTAASAPQATQVAIAKQNVGWSLKEY